jgi:exopolysaccharide biosynthesis polyprenyl glycosylphosphotransferase
MRDRDSADVRLSFIAMLFDALAVFGGLMLAVWIRFDSGWIPIVRHPSAEFYRDYAKFGAVVTLMALFVLSKQGLFIRPQTGTFINKIPRLTKAGVLSMLISPVLAFALQNDILTVDIARVVIVLSCITVPALLLLERYLLFRIEWNLARHSRQQRAVLILGTDSVAARLTRTFHREPMLRARVRGFLRMDASPPSPDIPPALILGDLDALDTILAREHINQVILAGAGLGSERMLDIMLLCERHLATFNMVPDMFHLMTSSMDVQSLDDIPLLGVSPWPLDRFWNRAIKRIEDVAGALFGMVILAPVMAAAALAIRFTSRGPILYRQERCGEQGRSFTLYKLRTMQPDAEKETGPVFTSQNDPRRTRVGAFLRRHNLDELPQLWNVLKGDMSLVGPRPERPHFVEQFKTEIARYMWRHVSKPGMTGWAQINGLRGDTSIVERVKYDLYYLENWSLAFDFKILLKTVFARQNAY